MRTVSLVALALALACPAVHAQSADSLAVRPATRAERARLVAGAVLGGVVVAVTVPPAAPFGVGGGIAAVGALQGTPRGARALLIDTSIGLGVGIAAGYLSAPLFLAMDWENSEGIIEILAAAGVGLLAGSVTAGVLSGARPVRIRLPDGTTVSGLAVRVPL